jgi:LL-diaminopimelate aminotransferase
MDARSAAAILPSWLEEQGENLFQEIKRVCRAAEAAGQDLIKLSVGQPLGPALKSARRKAAEYIESDEQSWHEYQDNSFLPFEGWAEAFCQAHIIDNVKMRQAIDLGRAAFMPIPGIKPMLGLIPLACGGLQRPLFVKSMTDPGYPVPKTWCDYIDVPHEPFSINPGNGFLPEVEEEARTANLLMFNLPHNPSGQAATKAYWRRVCAYCEKNGIRLFNDAAYILLSHRVGGCALAEVAIEFPGLSWMEVYSASKEISNGTGWRVGAAVGSPDFIGDLGRIKGNTDSGFNAALAAGALYALQNDMPRIEAIRDLYGSRLASLSQTLVAKGMNVALEPRAGFFLLCQAPQAAFGQRMEDAKQFNYTMIENTGIVGVHFNPYIRYAVVGPVEDWLEQIAEGFGKAKPEYDK